MLTRLTSRLTSEFCIFSQKKAYKNMWSCQPCQPCQPFTYTCKKVFRKTNNAKIACKAKVGKVDRLTSSRHKEPKNMKKAMIFTHHTKTEVDKSLDIMSFF